MVLEFGSWLAKLIIEHLLSAKYIKEGGHFAVEQWFMPKLVQSALAAPHILTLVRLS